MTRKRDEVTYEALITERLLAIDPIGRGFGFVVIEASPLQLIDWGVRVCDRRKRGRCSVSLEQLLRRYEPTAVIIEDESEARSLRRVSLASFVGGLADVLDFAQVPLFTYTRSQVRTAFGPAGAVTKDAIAGVLVGRFPELRPRVPRRRQPWESEDSRMSIFDALSFAVTHLTSSHRERTSAVER